MTTRTNLSALALKHSTLTLFFMLVLVAADTTICLMVKGGSSARPRLK